MFSPESIQNISGIRFYNFNAKSTPRQLCWSWYIEMFDSTELTSAICDDRMPEETINTSIVTNHGPLFCKFYSRGGYLCCSVHTTKTCACVVMVSGTEIIILPKNDTNVAAAICQDIHYRMRDKGITSSVSYH